jgi:hypothetical protein
MWSIVVRSMWSKVVRSMWWIVVRSCVMDRGTVYVVRSIMSSFLSIWSIDPNEMKDNIEMFLCIFMVHLAYISIELVWSIVVWFKCDRSWYDLCDWTWYDHAIDHGTIYVIDRGTIMCDRSWYDQCDRSWCDLSVIDCGTIYDQSWYDLCDWTWYDHVIDCGRI